MPKGKKILAINQCNIASDPKVRAANDAQTDAIKDNFPTGLARPALRALVSAGFTSLKHLQAVSEQDLAQLHGMGPHAIEKLRRGLNELGLNFLETS